MSNVSNNGVRRRANSLSRVSLQVNGPEQRVQLNPEQKDQRAQEIAQLREGRDLSQRQVGVPDDDGMGDFVSCCSQSLQFVMLIAFLVGLLMVLEKPKVQLFLFRNIEFLLRFIK